MTIDQRLAKQRKFRQFLYARRIVYSKCKMVEATFKLHSDQRGAEWTGIINKLISRIKDRM